MNEKMWKGVPLNTALLESFRNQLLQVWVQCLYM